MNESGDIPTLKHSSSTPDNSSCSIISIIPNIGMSSCRGRAEAFARSLSSKLRTLGSQSDDDCDTAATNEPIVNGRSEVSVPNANTLEKQTIVKHNNWVRCEVECENTVTNLQPLRCDTDSFFDFDCELESPGSPVDECEYLRLIETASTTPQNSVGESGYVCASTASSNSSTDGPYYEVNEVNELHAEQEQTLKEDTHQLNGTLTNETEVAAETIPTTTTTTLILDNKQDAQTEENQQQQQQAEVELQQAENIVYEQATEQSLLNGHATPILQTAELQEQEHKLPANISNNNLSNNQINNEQTITLSLSLGTSTIIAASKIDDDKSKSCTTLSGLDTTDDEDECRPQRVRRCSSLKTGKTPPGTPGRKKIVRFADKLGLDLADIKTFLDEIPNIPKSAYEDLEINDAEPPIQLGPKSDKLLVPLFQQPGGLPTFLDLVRERQVSLENAAVTDHINQTITGSVRVRNLDFHKSVHIRYTLDHWRSFADLQANYVENSCDGFSDKFSFMIFGNSMQIGQRMELAVRFQCKGQQFWDNNYGINYCFQCLPANNNNLTNIAATTPTTTKTITAASTYQTAAAATTTLNNNHHSNNHHNNNNNNNNMSMRFGSVNAPNFLHKPHNGTELEQNPNHVLRLLSPTVGEAWCNSFY